jgi:hypothetical protein
MGRIAIFKKLDLYKSAEIIVEWVNFYLRLPNRRANDEHQRSLSKRLGYIRQRKKNGLITNPELLDEIEKSCILSDIFTIENCDDRHREWAKELIGWIKDNNKIPNKSSSDLYEKKIGHRFSNIKHSILNGKRKKYAIIEKMFEEEDFSDVFSDTIKKTNDAINTIVNWYKANKRIPSKFSVDQYEKEIAVNLYYFKKAYRAQNPYHLRTILNTTVENYPFLFEIKPLDRWIKSDELFLTDNYNKYTDDEISELLNRTKSSITSKRLKMGLYKDDIHYSDSDIDFVKKNYHLMPVEEIAKKLNRTRRAIWALAHSLGCKKIVDISNEDFITVSSLVNYTLNEIYHYFDGKYTYPQLRCARFNVGIRVPKINRYWSFTEESLLRDNYNCEYSELLKLLPNHTKGAIRRKISNIGLKREYSHPNQYQWKDGEIELLTSLGGESFDFIRNLFPHIGVRTIKKALLELNINYNKKFKRWTIEENNYLRANNNCNINLIHSGLPERSLFSIRMRMRGLHLRYKNSRDNWEESEIDILFNSKYYSLSYIRGELPHRSKLAIGRKMNQLGIPYKRTHYSIEDRDMRIEDLPNIVRQVLIGGLLGDGCVTVGEQCIDGKYHCGHAFAQKEYCLWKMALIKDILKPHYSSKCRNDRYGAFTRFSTPSHPIFTEMRERFYGNVSYKNIIPLEYADMLDEFGLLIWYLDDGTLSCGKYPSIKASEFGRGNLREAVKLISQNLDIKMDVWPKEHKENQRSNVKFLAKNGCRDDVLSRFKAIALKYELPKCMMYKVEMAKLKNIQVPWALDDYIVCYKFGLKMTERDIEQNLSHHTCKAVWEKCRLLRRSNLSVSQMNSLYNKNQLKIYPDRVN